MKVILNMKLKKFIKSNAIIFSAFLVFTLIIANTAIIVYNNTVLERTTQVQFQTEKAKALVDLIWMEVVKNLDVGVRGFAINKDEGMLIPFKEAIPKFDRILRDLTNVLKDQGFEKPELLQEIKIGVGNFIENEYELLELARVDKMEEFKMLLKEDKGRFLWEVYSKNATIIHQFEDQLYNEAVAEYKAANLRIIYVQIILIIIGLPTLLFMVFIIRKDKKVRRKLFLELEKNNREYLFNPGTRIEITNEKELIDNSIRNYKNAAKFINQISQGNFEVQWEQINEKNREFNKTNLTGELIQMREKMKMLKEDDERRNWTTGGLAKFSEVIRNHQHNLQELCYEVTVFLVKYLGGQQGGFFVLREDEEERSYLELVSCYAFDKKKHIEKRVEIGQGLIGQTYLEQTTAMLTEIPQGYTHITSGLGDETPTCLLVVPMKYNGKVEAVIEIAGFEVFEQYQVEFMERVGEITASTLGAVKNNERTQVLLEQFKSQTEQLKAQEEELRQNMEEMEATQEAIKRQDRIDAQNLKG